MLIYLICFQQGFFFLVIYYCKKQLIYFELEHVYLQISILVAKAFLVRVIRAQTITAISVH